MTRTDRLAAVEEGSTFSNKAIYGTFSYVLAAVMVVTVIPHYFELIVSPSDVPFAIVVHSVLYLAWYILFSVQSNLSDRGKVQTHMRLGQLSLAFFVALFVSGVYLLLGVMQSYDPSWDPFYLMTRTSFVWGIIHTLFTFTVFYVLGLIYRKKLHVHKRFMLMASLSMVSASITRVAYLPVVPLDGMVVTLLSTYILLLIPIIIDRIHFKRVHSVLKWSIPLYIVSQIVCIGILPRTGMAQALAFPF